MDALVAANWKMNGLTSDLSELEAVRARLGVKTIMAPPVTLLDRAEDRLSRDVFLGAQDCHAENKGAHTGDVSAAMLKDLGVDYVIVGHSERRAAYLEQNEMVCAKADAVLAQGMTPIICVGEELDVRKQGGAEAFVRGQIKGSVPGNAGCYAIAYEPIWAIGTGEAAEPTDIDAMHRVIRELTGPDIPLLYGGSVKAANARAIAALDSVNGALVGGASLTAAGFQPIIDAFSAMSH